MKMRAASLLIVTLASATIVAQTRPTGSSPSALSAQDRAAIELLSARYSLALGSCDDKTWPELFVAPDGYFASGSRGKVQGRQRLLGMIRSYDCVYHDGVAPPHAPSVLVPYKIELQPSRGGATAMAYYNGGHYEDVYVKSAQGWRFMSRTVVSNREQAAGLSAAAFDAIQDLAAANGGPYVDVYETLPAGSRFKSAGVEIAARPEGITGKAFLPNNGGHYDDVYEKSPAGGWRFKSRVYVAPEQAAAAAAPAPAGTGETRETRQTTSGR